MERCLVSSTLSAGCKIRVTRILVETLPAFMLVLNSQMEVRDCLSLCAVIFSHHGG